MSQRTLLLIFCLFIITGILFVIALVGSKTNTIKSQITLSPTIPITSTPVRESLLSFSPPELNITKTIASHSAAITLSPLSSGISSLQITLSYDPHAFTTINIVPGDMFIHPQEVQKKFNLQEGTITYVLEKQSGVNMQSHTVAKLIFTPNPYELTSTGLPTTQTRISFLPKTAISTESIPSSTLDPQTFANILTIQYASSSAKL